MKNIETVLNKLKLYCDVDSLSNIIRQIDLYKKDTDIYSNYVYLTIDNNIDITYHILVDEIKIKILHGWKISEYNLNNIYNIITQFNQRS